MIKLSNIMIKAEPEDYLEPLSGLNKDEARSLIEKFIPIKERNPARWYRAMKAHGKKFIVTGIGKSYESMMEFEAVKS